VTSSEVARHSGVSRATVSYVLNEVPNQSISQETRQRVLATAARLGYTPYAPARALRSGRSDVVLFLIPEWPIGWSIASLVENLSHTLAAGGLTLVVHAHPRSGRPVSELWKAISPAAVINHQALNDREANAARHAGMLVVTATFNTDGTDSFEDFQRAIGRTQAEHLASRGHRMLGFALPDDDRLAAFANPRLDGVRETCQRLGLDPPDAQMLALDRDAAQRAIGLWRRHRPRVTGVCAYNDEIALAVLAGLRARQLTAPADMAVVGVDDIPAAAFAAPPLTTVATGMAALGRNLATAVIDQLHDQPAADGPGPDIIRLVHRDSS
jgi:DNA-binding LacI/PurR family transcriptional regulator